MDQKKQKQPVEGNDTPAAQAQGKNQIMPHPLSRPPTQTEGPSAFSAYPRNQQYSHFHDSHSHQNIHHLQQQELQKNLNEFWAKQYQEIEDDSIDFKTHCLPLARVKKIMKADEDVKMISAEAPMLFAKACEMFIMELTMRAWANAEVNKRRTLQKSDIASAISRTDVFDFLVDIVPKEDSMEHEVFLGMPRRDAAPIGNVPYYYVPVPVPVPVPPQHAAAGSSYSPPLPPPRMLMGRPFFDQPRYRQKLPVVPHPFATSVLQIPKQEDHSQDEDEDEDSDD